MLGRVGMALGCGVLIPYLMFTRQDHSIDQMTAVWLLPVVAAEVAAASGGLLAPYLSDTVMQFHVLITSYVLWAFSVPVAFSILTILILRMALHKLPHESMAASSWLALGPIGTGALGLLLLGADAPAIFAANGLAPGYFATEMNRALVDNQAFSEWLCKRTPAGRWGRVDELCGVKVRSTNTRLHCASRTLNST